VWFGDYGTGPAVVLAHGGMGNAGNFGHQVPALVDAGYRVIAIDTRGHGRSGWDGTAFSYTQFAEDVLAVLDHLRIERAAVVGWSDGACTGLALAKAHSERVAGVFFFACNVDTSGVRPFKMTDMIGNCLERHRKDYASLSPTPERFEMMSEALQEMQGSQPNYSRADLCAISVPVTVAWAEDDSLSAPAMRAISPTPFPMHGWWNCRVSAILRRCSGRRFSMQRCWSFWRPISAGRHDSVARQLAVCQDPRRLAAFEESQRLFHWRESGAFRHSGSRSQLGSPLLNRTIPKAAVGAGCLNPLTLTLAPWHSP